jgi:hypothetical protein
VTGARQTDPRTQPPGVNQHSLVTRSRSGRCCAARASPLTNQSAQARLQACNPAEALHVRPRWHSSVQRFKH